MTVDTTMISNATTSCDLDLHHLTVDFHLSTGPVRAVNGASLTFHHGTIHGLVGESGCGKSVLGLSLLGLLPPVPRSRR